METITSRANPLMTHIRKLSSSGSYRRQQGEFLCDSPKLLREALLWKAEVCTVLCTEPDELPPLDEAIRCVQVPQEVMASVSPMKTPQGVLFTCRLPRKTLPEKLTGKHYMVLDGVQDPGNVGTIWRTADALGADGLFLVNGCADPWNPKTVRATMGACFRLPVYETSGAELAALLEGAGLPLYATALLEDTVDIKTADLSRSAVVIGSEGRGVSRELLELSQKTLKIPMRARCESLNAAAAAAIVLWEMGG